jgi:glucose/arabinose dehydrogenase
MKKSSLAVILGIFFAGCTLFGVPVFHAEAQQPAAGTDEKVVGHTFVPARLEFSEDFIKELIVPDGFRVNVFANDLENPRIMAVGDNGFIYVTEPSQGRIVALRDSNGDGRADEKRVVVEEIDDVHGLACHGNKLYFAPSAVLYVAEMSADGSVGKPRKLIEGLPDGGQHPNRTLKFGPDGLLYLSIGSSCNACPEPNPEHATMLQIQLDENGRAERRIFAKGLRNTVGFGWHPVTREFWGLDMGSDWRGNDLPPEELNLIRDGLHYGWPWCYGKQEVDRIIAQAPEEKSREAFCAETEPSVLEYQAHSSPLQMVFYDGDQFPEEYRNDVFVTMRGSWNRKPPVGYKLMRLHFDENGRPERFEDFITGFITEDGSAFRARLVGVAIAPDGSLLFGDDTNGVIYRVSYRNDEES